MHGKPTQFVLFADVTLFATTRNIPRSLDYYVRAVAGKKYRVDSYMKHARERTAESQHAFMVAWRDTWATAGTAMAAVQRRSFNTHVLHRLGVQKEEALQLLVADDNHTGMVRQLFNWELCV